MLGVDNTMEKQRSAMITINEILLKLEKMTEEENFQNRIVKLQRSVSLISSYLKDNFSSDLNMDDPW